MGADDSPIPTAGLGPNRPTPGRRVVVMAEKSWASLFLVATLKRAGVNVVAMIVQRDATDAVFLSVMGWKKARKQFGLRASTQAFLGLSMGGEYHLRRLLNRPDFPTLRDICALGVARVQIEDFKSAGCHDILRSFRPDVAVICGTPILPDSLLSIPAVCTLNIHTSLLPHYRGGGSLFWPLFFRDTDKVGYTIHKAVAALDAGPFLYQERIPVLPADTPGTLLEKCFRSAAPKLASILKYDSLEDGVWCHYDKPLAYVHRRPHPEVYNYLLGSPVVGWAKKAARRTLNGALELVRGARPFEGKLTAFFFHRALPDNTPVTDWRRVLGHPTVSELREKLIFLKKHFKLISFSQWLALLNSPGPISEPSAAVLVDDGYRDFRTCLLPLLEALEVPAALFVCTGAVSKNTVWYQQVYNLIDLVRSDRLLVPWMDTHIYFGDIRHRVLTIERVLLAYLKRLRRNSRQDMVNLLLEANNAIHESSDADGFCDVADLQFLKRSPLVELYPHSHRHDPFETLTAEELRSDLADCRKYFSEELGLGFEVLSYPNGRFKAEQRELLTSAGIRYALTTVNGYEEPERFDNLALKRIGFGNESISDFAFQLRRMKVIR
jgi:methionyl-tRNA formyltransferase/peptidoglycan/xylan/chitin deacetylase (PgdA/CDA1 family)